MSEVRIGPFRVVAPLGEGGMGRVFDAIQEPLGRRVALKVIHPAWRDDDEQKRRFLREIKLAAALQHPGLVRVFDAGEHGGDLYLAMERIDGVPLSSALAQRGPLPWATAFAIAGRIADALACLHAAGIVHRDIKPGNVMLSATGAVTVLDYGLARSQTSTAITGTGQFVGTLRYVAPEILIGEPTAPSCDVWALGCVLHELLSGEPMVRAGSARQQLHELVNEPPRPLEELSARLPRAAAAVLDSLLDRDPTRRPTAAEAHARIAALLERLASRSSDDLIQSWHAPRPSPPGPAPSPPPPPSPSPPPPAPGAPARGSLLPLLTALTVPALLLIFFFTLTSAHEPRATRASPPPAPPPAPTSPLAPEPAPSSGFFSTHHLIRPHLARLRSGPESARRAAASLRLSHPLDLGSDPATWLRFLQLATWLASTPNSPPPLPDEGAMAMLDARLFFGHLSQRQMEAGAERAALIIRAVVHDAGDGRCWLALGRLLDQEARPVDSLHCYRVGLARVTPIQLEFAPRLVWSGLAQALRRVPGHDMNAEWTRWIPTDDAGERAWQGLADLLRKDEPAVFRTLVGVGLETTGGNFAAINLADVLEDDGRLSDAALLLERTLTRYPRDEKVCQAIIDHLLARGDLAPAQRLLARKMLDARSAEVVERVLRGEPVREPKIDVSRISRSRRYQIAAGCERAVDRWWRGEPQPAPPLRDSDRPARLLRALHAGRVDDAARLAWELFLARPQDTPWTVVAARLTARSGLPERRARLDALRAAALYSSHGAPLVRQVDEAQSSSPR